MTILTGTILSPAGSPVTGALFLQLSQDAILISGGGAVAALPPVIFNLTAGMISGPGTAPFSVPGADALNPSGLTYHLSVTGPGGELVLEKDVSITGTTVDLGLLASVSPASQVLPGLGGDVTGPASAARVVGLQGRSLVSTAPTSGQVIGYNGTAWAPTSTPTLPGFVRADGTTPLTADWNAGNRSIVSHTSVDWVNAEVYGLTSAGLQQAVNATPAGGTCYMSAKTWDMTSTVTLVKPIHLIGSGPGTVLQVNASVGATTDILVLRAVQVLNSDVQFFTFKDFRVTPASGTPGRYGLHIDGSAGGLQFLLVDRVNFERLGNVSIFADGSGFGSGMPTLSTIQNCSFSGMSMLNCGDSVRILDNGIGNNTATGPAIDLAFATGASTCEIRGNIFVLTSAAIHLGAHCTNVLIEDNEMETVGGWASANGALVDIDGPSTSGVTLSGNSFQIVNGVTADGIRVNVADTTFIYGNYFERGLGASADVRITASATNTMIGPNTWTAGLPLAQMIADAGVLTVYDFAFSGAKRCSALALSNDLTFATVGSATVPTSGVKWWSGSAVTAWIAQAAADEIAITTASTERLRVTALGWLLLGATTDTTGLYAALGRNLLQVSPNGATASSLAIVGAPGDSDAVQVASIDFDSNDITTPASRRVVLLSAHLSGTTAGNRGGYFRILTKADNGGLVERFRVDNAGMLWNAMGTASPTLGAIPGVIFTQTASKVTVANAATSLFGTGVGTLTLPANLLVAGRTIRIKMGGFVSQADTGAGTKTLLLSLGGVTVATGTSGATFATTLNSGWIIEASITCRTAGAGGTVVGGGSFQNEIATATANGVIISGTTTAACNTTGTLLVDLTFNNGSTPNGTITTLWASVEILN